MNPGIRRILVNPSQTIKEAMEVIDRRPKTGRPTGIAAIISPDDCLLGIVTDGDIRRAILKGCTLDTPVSEVMNRTPITVNHKLSYNQMYEFIVQQVRKRLMDNPLEKIVIVDDEGRLSDILSFFDLWTKCEVRAQRVCILGMGYVGLTLALAFADSDLEVLGVDINAGIIQTLGTLNAHFYEDGLNHALQSQLAHTKNLVLATDIEPQSCEMYVIAVGTPVDAQGTPIMDQIERASEMIGRALKKNDLVIARSTVPVGTCRNIILPILERESGLRAGIDFFFAFAPERTVAGNALQELRELPQVIGGLDPHSAELAVSFFGRLSPTIIRVDSLEEAEMVKLVNNSYRDFVFGFANELALICERVGLDVNHIIHAANKEYPRNPIPKPSPGVGGVCLTKDPKILAHVARQVGYEPALIGRSRIINEKMPAHIYDKISDFFESQNGRRDYSTPLKVFILGFAFKGEPETSDVRDSTALELVKLFQTGRLAPVELWGHDPIVDAETLERHGVRPASLSEGFGNAHCVVLMNNHYMYRHLDVASYVARMASPGYVMDGWNLLDASVVTRAGLTYATLSTQIPGTAV